MKKFLLTCIVAIAAINTWADGPIWTVSNSTPSIYGTCSYNVCFDFVLYENGNPVSGSGISICHSIALGSSANYQYPYTVGRGRTVVVLGIHVNIGGNSYSVPISGQTTIPASCADCGSSAPVTYWQSLSTYSFDMAGGCLL